MPFCWFCHETAQLFSFRCSLRQVDILATTLEPIKHRDYTVAVKHHYPTTPLKKTRDDPTKKKRKKKKLRRKKATEKKDLEAHDITLSSEHTIDDFLNLEGAETPESVIINIPNFVTREGEKLLEDKLNRLKKQRHKQDKLLRKQYEKSLAKVKSDKVENDEIKNDYSITLTGSIETVDDFAGALAEKIIEDTLSFTNIEQDSMTSSYAQNLASAILTQAMDNVVDIMTEKEKLIEKKSLVSDTLEPDFKDCVDSNTRDIGNELKPSSKQNDSEKHGVLKMGEKVSGDDIHDHKTAEKTSRKESLTVKSHGKQVDFRSPVPDTR